MENDFKVMRNTFSQIASRMIVITISLLTTAILTRILGVEGFGNYIFITSIILLFIGLTDFGTTTIAVREASFEKENKEMIFSAVLGLRILISLIVFLLINILILLLPQFNGLRQASFIGSFVLFFLVLRTTSQSVLQTFLRLDLSSCLEIIASVLLAVFLFTFLIIGKNLSLSILMVFWVVSAFLSGIFALVLWKKYLPVKISFNQERLKTIFKQSYPLGFYLLIYAVYDRGIDSFFLKTFSGSQAVGFYGLAYKIHGNLIFGAAFLMNSLFPVISSLIADRKKLENIFMKSFTVLWVAGLMVLVFGFLLAPIVVKLFAGSAFTISGNILRILLLATVFSFLNHLLGYMMIVLNEQKKLFHFSMVALILNLALNFVLIPLYSFWAAAVITVLTEGTIFLLCKNYLKKKYSLAFSLKDFRKCFILLLKEKKNYLINF